MSASSSATASVSKGKEGKGSVSKGKEDKTAVSKGKENKAAAPPRAKAVVKSAPPPPKKKAKKRKDAASDDVDSPSEVIDLALVALRAYVGKKKPGQFSTHDVKQLVVLRELAWKLANEHSPEVFFLEQTWGEKCVQIVGWVRTKETREAEEYLTKHFEERFEQARGCDRGSTTDEYEDGGDEYEVFHGNTNLGPLRGFRIRAAVAGQLVQDVIADAIFREHIKTLTATPPS